jgi:hypothetical protein
MILSSEQTNTVLSEEGVYDWILTKRRWSHLFLGNDVSPCGNIMSFVAPLNVGEKKLSKVLVFASELPNVAMFGGVCFQRLFTAQIGSILCELIGKSCYVDESIVFIENQQSSISVANHVKNSTLFHNVFSLCEANRDLIYPILLEEEKLKAFQEKSIGAFHYLTKSIFLESQRDNF